MTLDQMTNDQAAEAMVRISSAAVAICEDEDVQKALHELSEAKENDVISAIPKFLPMFTSLALKKHRSNLYEIVSALTDKPVQEVGKMKFGETVSAIKDNIDTLKGFFI